MIFYVSTRLCQADLSITTFVQFFTPNTLTLKTLN